MKNYCRHPACPLPRHEYDETEFMQYLSYISPADQEAYLVSHWCPECYERTHHLISSGVESTEEKEESPQVLPVF